MAQEKREAMIAPCQWELWWYALTASQNRAKEGKMDRREASLRREHDFYVVAACDTE
jgi:hypothetical protein